MLWYKGWLETRYRLLFCMGWATVFLGLMRPWRMAAPAPGATASGHGAVYGLVALACPTLLLVACAMIGGSGIVTQPSLQASKGLHGSTLYTLSLPVSRVRLLLVRAGVGWLEIVGVAAVLCTTLWALTPALREAATPREMAEYAVTLIACGSTLYGISVLLATFLDDVWRTWGTMMVSAGLWWMSLHVPVPETVNIFRAMREGSPVLAHTMPWAAMGFSVALGAALLLAATRIVQAREY
ncbi:MAG: hypothetical protein PW789_08645 [Edaphobacter sp.]|uniref:hypothetical protein n=1 Tax=Edaphobacter sp. TaxID=1934404 RepID=UPI0023924210|nr:hypothetical protein [Edaphobacter sp.]MDE1176663.1 hypothetical protein [Edaphobacter sp.]